MDLATTYTIKARVTGQESLNGLNKGLGKVKESSNKTAVAFNKLKRAGSSLMGVLGSIGATAAVTGFVKAGVDMQRTQKTLKILTDEYGEHKQVLDFVGTAADRFGLGQQTATKGVSDLFARLRPMGISLDQIKDTYLGLNNAALRYNLSSHDLAGVQLQLGQALGSGVLQGDEFRSIMERLPAIGQAVADVMGVQVGQLKQLSSDGELTTEVIIKAMQKLKDMDVPPPDAFRLFRKEMENLSTIIGTKLLPAFTPIVRLVSSVLNVFSSLPAPLQTIIALTTALGAGLVIIAPALGLIVTGFGALGSVIGAVVGVFAPLLAGGAIPLAIIGLGALIFKFRDQIAEIFKAIGRIILAPFNLYAQFVGNVFNSAINMARNAFSGLPKIVQNAIKLATLPLRSFINTIKGALNLLNRLTGRKAKATGIDSPISTGISSTSTTLPSSTSSSIPSPTASSIPRTSSAAGRVPNLSMNTPKLSGSGGYAFPGQDLSIENIGNSPAAQEARRRRNRQQETELVSEIINGVAHITQRKKSSPKITIQTGAVTQMNGTNFVTTQELANAVQSSVAQTMNYIEAGGERQYLGM